MHRVRAWAHSSAHKNKFNPWSQDLEHDAASKDGQAQIADEEKRDERKESLASRFLANAKTALFHSWVNVLLIFVPVGIAVHFANVNPNVVFALNAVAVIPLAGLLTFATESVAHRLGPTLGALMNVSIIALVKNEIRIVQAALIGSLLANLLLILGMAFLIGGLEYQEQIYDSTVTQMSAALLALAVLSLLIPTTFHASFNDLDLADRQVLKLSRGTSVILLLIYFLYLLFQLKSHAYLYVGTPQHRIDEQSAPGILARFDSTSSSSATSSRASTSSTGSRRRVRKGIRAKLGRKREERTEETIEAEGGPLTEEPETLSNAQGKRPQPNSTSAKHQNLEGENPSPQSGVGTKSKKPNPAPRGISFRTPPVFRSTTLPPGSDSNRTFPAHPLRLSRSDPGDSQPGSTAASHTRRTDSPKIPAQGEAGEAPMSQSASIVLLLISTGLVALCAEFLVGSIEHLVENTPISEAFIGLIILPIVGNAAEHVTAVTVAAKNKLDLALGVALGSSIQIALFVTPFVVILGWILDKNMSLYFSLFETGSLFVATFIVNFLVLDGRSNYLEGALLCACYIIVA
ncbi:uncharacterized protein A1O9_04493 [Exophiala aquamarina CBS 119918]|uniref:Sodium/calcium exchanger membrane region domain-containing protein n=1 Tax=Exophiala aquamarina CBS 119918 TaxID=1182545 RepID=A0A072PIS2_9EURO|nr:uncharacterized protein A1O9_04493 [Exophiala aquamarina CBS 119918]KEF59647.1 hypothetical protein A1O9_04493 [Exophiala aquamarina CBS 119918]